MSRDQLLEFYRLRGGDARGRTLRDIWTWDRDRLERVHDYIQWLFPLAEPSAFNPDAPLLTDATIAAFREDATLRDHLRRSFELMLDFYGLELRDAGTGRITVVEGADWIRRSADWLQAGNHNHLRITRILSSLHTLGLADCAEALFDRLRVLHARHPGAISPVTFGYWSRAASGF